MIVRARIAALAAALLVGGGMSAQADVVVLTPSKDNTMLDSAPDWANGAGNHTFAGRTSIGGIHRGLVQFDLSAIRPGSTITAVSLQLHLSRARGGASSVSLHRLTASWGEGTSNAEGEEGALAPASPNESTWNHRHYPTIAWTTPGGDFIAAASATTSVGTTLTNYTWSSAGMVADVQGWLNNPATNFGWIIRGNEVTNASSKRFDTREAGGVLAPQLTVTFTPPPGACCVAGNSCISVSEANCTTQGGIYQGDGSLCTPNPCVQPMGACCFPNGNCRIRTNGNCAPYGGTYQGDGTSCTPNPCPPPTGACCFPNSSCSALTQANCTTQGGTYRGDFVACAVGLCPWQLEPFVDPLPIPAVAQPASGQAGGAAHYNIAITEFTQQLHRDLPPTRVWGYGGSYPGPTIEARRDLPVTVTWINDLRDAQGNLRTTHYLPIDPCMHGPDMSGSMPVTVTHLHGARVRRDSDGYPEASFAPGESSTLYTYPNIQQAATLWYHDHALGLTRLNVYMGLAGFYLLRDAAEDALNIPRGEYEIPLAIQDRSFNPDGSLRYLAQWNDHFFGELILVNGKVWPYLNVKRGKYRFRLLDGSNSRTLTLSLSNGATFWLIGTDNGLVAAPVPLTSLTLAPGERADIVIDFAPLAPGTQVILQNSAPAPYPGAPGVGVVPNVMKFIVGSQTGHTAPLPATLVPFSPIPDVAAAKRRTFNLRSVFDPDCDHDMWTINDLLWDDITEYPRHGTTEVWSWVNRSGVVHPMHMHLEPQQLLDRQDFEIVNGEIVPSGPRVPPQPYEVGWKDTFQAMPNQITRVIMYFNSYTGKYPYHCHVLEHEDHEMMRQFVVVLEADLNCDEVIDVLDINPFILALSNPAQYVIDYPNCEINAADCNRDGQINVLDINRFVQILSEQ